MHLLHLKVNVNYTIISLVIYRVLSPKVLNFSGKCPILQCKEEKEHIDFPGSYL